MTVMSYTKLKPKSMPQGTNRSVLTKTAVCFCYMALLFCDAMVVAWLSAL